MNLPFTHTNRKTAQIHAAIFLASVITVIAALTLLIVLTHTVATITIPFDSDEAEHAVDGWQVYHSLIRFNVVDLFQAITSPIFFTAVGSGVTLYKEGDRVGVPWLHSACGHCEYCFTGYPSMPKCRSSDCKRLT
ncbi:MAG: alcohol dehydrogenase catalytic domain-containing protein [Coleofasciculus sp. D1-CHI-01]